MCVIYVTKMIISKSLFANKLNCENVLYSEISKTKAFSQALSENFLSDLLSAKHTSSEHCHTSTSLRQTNKCPP